MIKVMRPQLPLAADLMPYLEAIDRSRQYSNNGQMARALEHRAEVDLGAHALAVSNGTVALQIALRALGVGRFWNVLTPAMTFAASGLAIQAVGATPLLCDIHPGHWTITPEHAIAVERSGYDFDAVMPVCTFGSPVDVEAWSDYSVQTGKAVVIDGAGATHAYIGTRQTVVMAPRLAIGFSMHATKFIAAGEGGLVISSSVGVMNRARELVNFRGGEGATNGKMSEYHAAVGIASWETWKHRSIHANWQRDVYRKWMPKSVVMLVNPAPVLMPVLLPLGILADGVQELFAQAGVETKQWYRPFLDEALAPGSFRVSESLMVTDDFRARMLGLPFHPDLSEHQICTICNMLDFVTRPFE